MSPGQVGFRCVLCLSAVPLAECRLLHCYHGFCDGCVQEWLESNRVGPQRRLRKLHCPTCRKPASESDLGRMFVETVMLDEDAEYQGRLMKAIAEQTNSARDSVRTINATSSPVQVTRAMSGVVQSRDALSVSQYAETEPVVRSAVEKLTEIVNDLDHRVRPVFERVSNQDQEITTLKTDVIRLKDKLQSVGAEKQQVELYLEDALLAAERLQEFRNSAKLAALQKAQEAEALSKEVARLLRQSFAKGNEIADLKEQCNEHQAEIERLNELLKASRRGSNGKRRLDETDDNDAFSPPPTRDQPLSPLRPTKRAHASGSHDYGISTGGSNTWKACPTLVFPPGNPKSSKPNPFRNDPVQIRPKVINTSSDVPRQKLFQSDWNLGHLKEKKRKPESSLPFRIDSRGKPLVSVALGSRQRMSSKS